MRREPNIQNIVIRTPEGRKIREAFADTKQFDADYSWLEARIIAQMKE